MRILFHRLCVIAIIIPLFLNGCAIPPAARSAKLDNDTAPIKDLTVIIWFGGDISGCAAQSAAYSSKFREAMLIRLPAIFEANGIHVTQTLEEKTRLKYKRLANGELTLPLLENVRTTHTLVLIAEKISYQGDCRPDNKSVSVGFDARIWDVAKRRPVWSADPTLQLVLNQPLLRSQFFAASLLAAMHKDGLIRLSTNTPIDLVGKPITAEPGWVEDR